MNLIEKKINSLVLGSNIEILLSDGTKVSGRLTERDDECIEIINQSEENIIFIKEIKSVKLCISSNNSDYNSKKISEKSAGMAMPVTKPGFVSKFSNPKMSDMKITSIFRDLLKEEKKYMNSFYTSFMSGVKNNDMTKALSVVNTVNNNIRKDSLNTEFSENMYRLVGYMYSRCGVYEPELYIKGKCYDLAAIAYYKNNNKVEAAASASAAVIENSESEYIEAVYNVLFDTMQSLNDAGAVIAALNKKPLLLSDKYMKELLNWVYRKNGRQFSASVNTASIISFLKAVMPNNVISEFMKGKKNTSSGVKDEKISLTGNIIKISWIKEVGEIETNDKIYKFAYKKITDKTLLEELRKLLFSDLKGKREEIPVSFEVCGEEVLSVKRFNQNTARKPSKIPQNYLQIGRAINANHESENRFHKSLGMFLKSIEAGENVPEAVAEAINCYLVIANKEEGSQYIEAAYELYDKHRYEFNTTGLQYNSVIFNLLAKTERYEESLECLNRILADENLPHATRLHFIDSRANVYFSIAQAGGDLNMYENAKNECRKWEQIYLDNKNLLGTAFTNHYYNYILYKIAYSLYKTGNTDTAADILETILKYNPENEDASRLSKEINAERQKSELQNGDVSQEDSFAGPEEITETTGCDESGDGLSGVISEDFSERKTQESFGEISEESIAADDTEDNNPGEDGSGDESEVKTGDAEETAGNIMEESTADDLAEATESGTQQPSEESDSDGENGVDYDKEQETAESISADISDVELDFEIQPDYIYTDCSGWDALNLKEDDVVKYAISIKGKSRLPVSVTYLKAAVMLNPYFKSIYNDISLAVDNPMEDQQYAMTEIILKYGEEKHGFRTLHDICFAAAFLRSSFYGNTEESQFSCSDYLSSQVSEMFPSLKKAVEITDEFRTKNGVLIDKYADYRNTNLEELQIKHDDIVKEAANVYDRYFNRVFHEDKNQLRFKLTKSFLFENNGLPERMMYFVSHDDYQGFKEIESKFKETFLKNSGDFSVSSIHGEKIDNVIDQAWKRAGDDKSVCERKSSDLMGSFRNNLYSPLSNCVKIVCEWLELYKNGCNLKNTESYAQYLQYKKQLLPLFESLRTECESLEPSDPQTDYGRDIIKELAQELSKRLEGTWNQESRKYYFSDFLRTNHILLNQDYMPDLSSTFCDLPDFNVLRRIRDHAEDNQATISSHGEQIFSRAEESHDFGTAGLIAGYLKYIGDEQSWKIPENAQVFEEQAKRQMYSKLSKFNSDICIAISRGQINKYDQFLNGIESITRYWYQFCLDTKNYGFFSRFVSSCMNKIQSDAVVYGQKLMKQLDELVECEKPEQSIIDKIADNIDKQFFTVAEDYMSRIAKGDFDRGSRSSQDAEDCLKNFWNEFEEIYKTVFASGYTLRRAVRKNIHVSKDRKGGEALINNWLDNGRKTSAERISTLLNLLGWDNIEVTDKSTDAKNEIYHVQYGEGYKDKNIYSHPIPAFGSSCKNSGFYVVCLYGYSDSKRLIDKYMELDSISGNKIILLDYAINAAERRSLAKQIRQTSLMWTYMLIDRVTIMYIANHYISGGNNRTLMSIAMPFAYLQPYVYESTYNVPPEMFIGRRDELLSIESATGANLVYGGRQLGKSALLKKAKYEIDDPENGKLALFIDINGLDIKRSAEKVSQELLLRKVITDVTDSWEKLALQIKEGITNSTVSYILLMMDEADKFIDDCKNVNYQPLVCLKDIQQSLGGRFKFVMAGLHETVKFHRSVALGNNSVISHFSSINITPFAYEYGKELLTKPLSYLGYNFGSETMISHILSTTNYFPGIIQLFCSKLIKSMKKYYFEYNESVTPPYTITESHIGRILTDKDFIFAVKNCFEITLMLDDEYYIIALFMAYLSFVYDDFDGCTAETICENLREFEVKKMDWDDVYHIESLMDELCDLNVLKKVNNRFSFRTKNFIDMLGNKKEIENAIFKIIS